MADNSNWLAISTQGVARLWDFGWTISSIQRLLLSGCPTAIVRTVSKFVVNSINRFSAFWTWSHISEKICKGAIPARADFYATPTVVLVVRMVAVAAPLPHRHPANIFRRMRSASSMPGQCVAGFARAAAASAALRQNTLGLHVSDNAAFTSTGEDNFLKLSFGIIKNNPFRKYAANMVDVIVGLVLVCHRPVYPQKQGVVCHVG